jgi:hypothetical protein
MQALRTSKTITNCTCGELGTHAPQTARPGIPAGNHKARYIAHA